MYQLVCYVVKRLFLLYLAAPVKKKIYSIINTMTMQERAREINFITYIGQHWQCSSTVNTRSTQALPLWIVNRTPLLSLESALSLSVALPDLLNFALSRSFSLHSASSIADGRRGERNISSGRIGTALQLELSSLLFQNGAANVVAIRTRTSLTNAIFFLLHN